MKPPISIFVCICIYQSVHNVLIKEGDKEKKKKLEHAL